MATTTPTPFPPSPVPTGFPAPTVTSMDVASDPTWLDLANFWVNALGTIATVLIAAFAVWLTVATARATNRRDERARREAWVRDYMLWLDDGSVYMAAGMDAAILTDRAWISRGTELDTRARILEPDGTINNVLESRGASSYMTAARTAREHIATLPVGDRVEASITATRMLKFWAEGWVDHPKNSTGDITEWITPPSP